jgi:hypothetical protein
MHKRTTLGAAVCLLAMVTSAKAQVQSQPYVWNNVKITAGGFITGIVFSNKEAGLAYCRTDIGGAYRFEAKRKAWVSLTDWVGPGNANLGGCESIAVDPTNGEKVYLALGTYSRGIAAIARSGDRGNTFALTQIPVSMGANEDGRGMGERLAVDPSDPRVLYFGSRQDGLWCSKDGAETWTRVETFPRAGGARGAGSPGIPWVIFAPGKDDKSGEATRNIFAGVAGGENSLYRSVDSGKTWEAVAGAPPMMPHRAALEPAAHMLFMTFGNGPGPNGVTAGAVWRLELDTMKWTNITPSNPGNGGYGGLALDAQHPGTLMVSTIDHWGPADEIFRSTHYGAEWKPIAASADRQTTGSAYMADLLRGHRFDWWLAALAIDPFDSNHVMFGTGATIWGSHDMMEFDAGKATHWNIEADGIEETAVLALASPPWGETHLISGVGDIGGFTHTDLKGPAEHHRDPMFGNTTSIEFAEKKPVVVRTGTAQRNGSIAAYSEDGGITWRPLSPPGTGDAPRGPVADSQALTVCADGTVVLAGSGDRVSFSRDKGATWSTSAGLSVTAGRPFADRVADRTFYELDGDNQRIYVSVDGGEHFSVRPVVGLPTGNAAARGRGGRAGLRVKASFAGEGDLWAIAAGNLFRSTDGGAHWKGVTEGMSLSNMALGKAAPGRENPALYVTGTVDRVAGIFRSDDDGKTWRRINDDQHQFGGTPTVIAGDPRVFGRLYIGMNGRGILYGDLRDP